MTQALQNRLDLLEAHVAEQERVIQDMSEVLAKQWSSLDAMSAKVDRLLERLGALESQSDELDSTPPPHY